MLQKMPYFMENEDWFRDATPEEEDQTGRGLVLTDAAPQEAIESYNEFYQEEVDLQGRVAD